MLPWRKPKPTAKEAARETKREVRSAQRGIDRELRELERQERTLLADIKKRAKTGGITKNDSALKALSKQLVHTRGQKDRLQESKSQIGSMALKATAMSSQVAAAQAVGKVTQAMGNANQAVDIKKLSAQMGEFMRQNEMMDLKEDLFNDALADAFDGDEVEEEADAVTDQILAELGLELSGKMEGLNVPSAAPPVAEEEVVEDDGISSNIPDLQSRLNAL
uniref:Uncharacterized protein n=1 Tax=Corethron hystrix TaxID=216773 RepID=A0A7S1BMU4_9STRA|mmetsp:Transcript_33185/g.76571  ORF Transcript_33185/g.76571 Transcript_33185/m.76571 type:complete len:221 (+) Transcript_33185:326-988(+)|eukprot:CAMPEP_0113297440 /NCGR_PEP_ID=MMETSP0010_2-20120614/302_1 /TAXON_ID=216773 ORGANISM="Corethron hystrix, Strain 308" /NCGR_SAMPLE_ID=MMETSP0010_2 /ASSEMBLY_ACC=CAM_ASM_000155 /LENGTH=220 /DNA_ID=CAMNT_0000150331 /DNA_START=284 /DNA_END=946 /DNA_ORIENTATION=- /assembly_acc=CAM_ASM_000155